MGRTDVDAVIVSGTAGATAGLQFALISAALSGANTLLAANSTKKIKVVGYVLVAASGVSVTFKSNTTALSGAMPLAANGGVATNSVTYAHLFETAVNESLILTLSAAVLVAGHFSYFLE